MRRPNNKVAISTVIIYDVIIHDVIIHDVIAGVPARDLHATRPEFGDSGRMEIFARHQKNEGRHALTSEDEAAAVAAVLAGAPRARSDPTTTERAVQQALALAPDDIDARLAAYRFYFYNHRLAEALPHAASIIVQAARRLNVATDWRLVRPRDAAFSDVEEAPSLYLQALLAFGYGSIRLGRADEGCRALEKVVELDPRDRFGARRLLAVIAACEEAEEN